MSSCKMQLAENLKYNKDYFGGRVPKLSPHHLYELAPKNDISMFESLQNKGITSYGEYESRGESSVNRSQPRNLEGCQRFNIDSYEVLTETEEIKQEIRNSGPAFGGFYVYDGAGKMDKPDAYCRAISDVCKIGRARAGTVAEGVSEIEKVANEPLMHAVTLIGYGKCVERGEEEYFVIQITYRTQGIPLVRDRVSCECFDFVISATLAEDED